VAHLALESVVLGVGDEQLLARGGRQQRLVVAVVRLSGRGERGRRRRGRGGVGHAEGLQQRLELVERLAARLLRQVADHVHVRVVDAEATEQRGHAGTERVL